MKNYCVFLLFLSGSVFGLSLSEECPEGRILAVNANSNGDGGLDFSSLDPDRQRRFIVDAKTVVVNKSGAKLIARLNDPLVQIGHLASFTIRLVNGQPVETDGGFVLSRLQILRTDLLGLPYRAPVYTLATPSIEEMQGGENFVGFPGGLYGSYGNTPPDGHGAAVREARKRIRRLNVNGFEDPEGKIVKLSVGMSNTSIGYLKFKNLAMNHPQRHPSVAVVNGAQSSVGSDKWANPNHSAWAKVDTMLAQSGLSRNQVQIVYMYNARPNPTGSIANYIETLRQDFESIIAISRMRYPNLRQFIISDVFNRQFSVTEQNPEFYARANGHAVQQVVLNHLFESTPAVLWGPRLWSRTADKRNPICPSSFVGTDYSHLSTSGTGNGAGLVGEKLLEFFLSDEATTWFRL